MGKRQVQRRLTRAAQWPKGRSDDRISEFVSTHDLAEVVGSGERVDVKFSSKVLERTQQKRVERMLVALRLDRKDLEEVKRIARERDIPYTALMRSWVRAGLRREKQRAG